VSQLCAWQPHSSARKASPCGWVVTRRRDAGLNSFYVQPSASWMKQPRRWASRPSNNGTGLSSGCRHGAQHAGCSPPMGSPTMSVPHALRLRRPTNRPPMSDSEAAAGEREFILEERDRCAASGYRRHAAARTANQGGCEVTPYLRSLAGCAWRECFGRVTRRSRPPTGLASRSARQKGVRWNTRRIRCAMCGASRRTETRYMTRPPE
jgi:hypothetical protein